MQEEIIQKLDEMGKQITFIEKQMIETATEEFLTVREACDFTKMSRSKFMELKKDGLLKVYKVRGKLLTKRSELISFIESTLVDNHHQAA